MQQKNKIMRHWSTVVGEFYNPDHDQIKKKLLTFFEDYKKKYPSSRKGDENFNLYESRYDLHQESNQDLQKVLQFISKCVFSTYQEASKAYILERGRDKKYRVETELLGLLPTKAVVSFHHTLMIIVVGLVYIMFNQKKILIKKMELLFCRHHIPD